MTVSQTQKEFDTARASLDQLGRAVLDQLKALCAGFEAHDHTALAAIVARDREIDRLELQLDNHCMLFIENRAPLGPGFRFMLGAIEIARGLERAGDCIEYLAVHAMRASTLDEEFPEGYAIVRDMMGRVAIIVEKACLCWSSSSPELAHATTKLVAPIEELRSKAYRMAVSAIRADRVDAELGMEVVLIANMLETIGDIAAAMAETMLYIVSAQSVRHNRSERLATALRLG